MVISAEDPDSKLKRDLRDKYTEFLGLPLDITYHNSLTFAVAHRVHGQQMLTGWRVDTTSLRARLDEDKNNNILIENRSSNYIRYASTFC